MQQNKIDEIIKLYQSGVNRWNITLQTGSSKKTVNKVLSNFGIDFKEEETENYNNRISQIIPLYQSGVSQVDLEKKLNLTRKTIREILKNSNVEYRRANEAVAIARGNQINHKVFDNLEDERVLYWIGLIYTDGHVNISGKDNSIEIALHYQDRELLEKLKSFLNTSAPITKVKDSNCYKFRFFSERIVLILKDLGFTNNKSKILVPDEKLKNSRHFWRGCIDGDGSLYFSKPGGYNAPCISLVGTYDTCKGLLDFTKIGNITSKRNVNKANGNNLHRIDFSWKKALQVADLLYKDSKIYMNRKYQKYLEFKEYFKPIKND